MLQAFSNFLCIKQNLQYQTNYVIETHTYKVHNDTQEVNIEWLIKNLGSFVQ